MLYHERVPADMWFRWGIRLISVLPVVAVTGSLFATDEVGAAERAVGVISMVVVGIVLVFVDRWFMVLDVTVRHDAVEARFGPFRNRITRGQIEDVDSRPYQWLRYGGWGIRGLGKRRAWSVPFLRSGVEFALTDGRQYFISSRTPGPFLAAVEQIAGQPGRVRGSS